jgi:stage V sporulation protein AE
MWINKLTKRCFLLEFIKAFLVGGFICVIGQILIDKTKLTAARILVFFVILGCLLGGLGIYEKIVEFGGAGATVPLPGFGYILAKGVKEEIDKVGIFGIMTGGLKAGAAGISAAMIFSFLIALVADSNEK